MLEEQFSTSKLVQGIEGKVTAELFDAKTGELVQREETHNFIAKPAVDFLQQAQRTVFKKGMYTLNSSVMQDYQLLDKQNATLALSGLLNAEDPTNETHMYGKPIGYARRATYSGSSTMRGSVNVELSNATPGQVTWVLDWPTQAANGVIGSVGWVKSLITAYSAGTTLANSGSYIVDPSETANGAYGFGLASSLIESYSPVANDAIGIICKGPGGDQSYFAALPTERPSSNYFSDGYVASSSNSYNVHAYDATMQQTATFSVQSGGIGYARGLTWDTVNSRLWVLGTGLKIAAFTSAGTVIAGTTVNLSSGGLYRGLAFDGEYLWVGDNSGSTSTSASIGKLWRINPANGSVVGNFTFPQAYNYSGSSMFLDSIRDISFDQERSILWVRTATLYESGSNAPNFANEIKAFDVDGNIAAYSVMPSPWVGKSGIGTVGGHTTSPSDFDYGRPSGNDTYDDYNVSTAIVNLSISSTSGMGCEYIGDNMFMICNSSSSTSNRCYKVRADGLGSRALLPTPIAKTDSQTLRITYQVNFS